MARGCLGLACLALSADAARAQEPFTNGANHPGTLVLNTTNAYTFTASGGEQIILRAGAGTYPPRIVVHGPDGGVLAGSSSFSAAARDTELTLQAPVGGTYTVRLSTHLEGTSGGYVLRFLRIPGEFVISEQDEGGPLTNGWQHTGAIEMGDLDAWTFTANAGDGIVVRMGGPALRPLVRVFGPNGALLAASTSTSGADRDGEVSFRATNSGPFTVVASAFSANGVGDYILTLAKAPGEVAIAPGDSGGPLTNGWQHTGSIDVGDLDVWTFDASAGDGIIVRMGGPALRPLVRLFGPNGVLLAASTSSSGADRDGEVSLRATNSGPFTVVASAFSVNGNGAYILTLAKAPGDVATAPGDSGGPLTNGWQNAGTIGMGDLDVWTFDATAGESIIVRMGGVGYTPRVRLYGPDGALLASSTSSSTADRDGEATFRATNSGPFTVVASAYRINNSGSYLLSLAKAPGTPVIHPGDEGGSLTNGWQHTGTIDMGDLDVWTFHADAGDTIIARMGGTGYTPQVRLFGPDGALLAANASFSTTDRDGEALFRATNSGVFTVVASAYRINNAGPYLLSLAKAPGTPVIHPDDEGGSLTNGWQHTGTIDMGDLDVWTFHADAGDSIIARMGGAG